jgi:galactokinase
VNLRERTALGFARHFGHAPTGVAFAPGRVNLIGEHVDYNDGLVLPMPIRLGTAVAWSAAKDGIEAVALDLGDATDGFALGTGNAPQPPDWRAYLRGMAACLGEAGVPLTAARLAIAGNLSRGAGLSSSASLCIATGRALSAAAGIDAPEPRVLAMAAQQAEHRWAGVHCGIMDQMAIAAGEPGAALLLDCRDLATRPVPLPADWAVLIVQSGVRRELVDGHYNQRREYCEAAAAALGLISLRDATLGQIEASDLAGDHAKRARHVVSEIARTSAAVTAIGYGDLQELGEILRASHASLRDDFEVSVSPVDRLVECLNLAVGPLGGARMTGGGFGGAAVAVLAANEIERVSTAVRSMYRCPDGTPPEILVETGAGREDPGA